MKFKMIVKDDRGEWAEEYEKDTEDVNQCAYDIIDYFNRSLRPGELPRKLVRVEVIEEGNEAIHNWDKLTAGMSVEKKINGKKTIVDLYRCRKCMITGYRIGFQSDIRRDHKYRSKKYDVCNWRKQEVKNESDAI